MRVEILGSGGAVTIPRPGCGCRVCIEARDKKFDLTETRRFLETLNPREVSTVAE